MEHPSPREKRSGWGCETLFRLRQLARKIHPESGEATFTVLPDVAERMCFALRLLLPLVSAPSVVGSNLALHIATLLLKFVCAVHQDCSISTWKFMKIKHFQKMLHSEFQSLQQVYSSFKFGHSHLHCSSSSQQSAKRFKPEVHPHLSLSLTFH